MPTSDPLDILRAHDPWATNNLLEACTKLSSEQFHERFEMGPGSRHDTITHILGAMQGWGDLLAGREQRPRLEGTERTPQDLLQQLDEISIKLGCAIPPDEPESCDVHLLIAENSKMNIAIFGNCDYPDRGIVGKPGILVKPKFTRNSTERK